MASKLRPRCGNPVFLGFMEELRDEARDKGAKSAEAYGKACRAISACPTTFDHPRELVQLTHVGEKTVQLLEKKWRAWLEEQGVPPDSILPPAPKAKAKGEGKGKRNADADADADADENDAGAKPKKARKPAAPKKYIPARGSGAYGILMALVLAIDEPHVNTQVFLTKAEIVRVAQEYSDTSYDHSEKGTYFTAWSGLKVLVEKGYVYVTGNPHKHCLTEEGYDVAVAIRNLRPEFAHMEKAPFSHDPNPGARRPGSPSFSRSTSALAEYPAGPPAARARAPSSSISQPRALPPRSPGGPEKFRFWYVSASGERTLYADCAHIRLDPDEFVGLKKIEFREAQRSHVFARQLRLVDERARVRDASEVPTLFGFVLEAEAPPRCSTFEDSEVPAAAAAVTTAAARASGSGGARSRGPGYDGGGAKDDGLAGRAGSTGGGGRGVSGAVLLDESESSSSSRLRSSSDVARAHRAPSVDDSDVLVPPGARASSACLPAFTRADALTFPAGSYEIVLVVDTREVESKSSRDKIAETLQGKGVRVETRALRLGDMCWVARRTEGGLGGEEDECVLDYVVERKRLDDLCSSIRDGRYNEQCFRLSNSGLGNIYYIVEEFQTNANMETNGVQILTAKSQVQLHNRFHLKETRRLSETIDFLATMTSVIEASHRGRPVHVIPTRFLSRRSYAPLQAHLRRTYPGETFHTSFVAYQALNDKSASQTVKDKFGRMLLCVKGMGAERVAAVLDVWETPRALWEEMKARDRQPEEGGGGGGRGRGEGGRGRGEGGRGRGEGGRGRGEAGRGRRGREGRRCFSRTGWRGKGGAGSAMR